MKKIKQILLVDDDEATNVFNQLIINEAQITHEITIKETGKHAIEYLLDLDSNYKPFPEIIFLDINMPVMNGWEFLEAYEKYGLHKKNTSIVVMLTASLNPDDKKKAKSISIVDEFRHKPITQELLYDIISKHLAKLSKQQVL